MHRHRRYLVLLGKEACQAPPIAAQGRMENQNSRRLIKAITFQWPLAQTIDISHSFIRIYSFIPL